QRRSATPTMAERMATPEPSPTSRRLRSAAIAERERLLRQLHNHEERIGRAREEVARRLEEVDQLRSRLALLAQITHDDPDDSSSRAPHPLRAVPPAAEPIPAHGYLRGADIRIAAVRLLASDANPTTPIHYTDWFKRFAAAGYGIAGRDPLASFLTQ